MLLLNTLLGVHESSITAPIKYPRFRKLIAKSIVPVLISGMPSAQLQLMSLSIAYSTACQQNTVRSYK